MLTKKQLLSEIEELKKNHGALLKRFDGLVSQNFEEEEYLYKHPHKIEWHPYARPESEIRTKYTFKPKKK